ncbi:MAG: hypothetical protein OES15_08400 [Nitrosopumilus sp.]|nr:hypothetical protein [Nitrosopumilus sp.]
MNKVVLIPSIAIIAIAILLSYVLIPDGGKHISSTSNTLSLSYIDTNKELQYNLDLFNIQMSSPLKLNGFSIDKYCTFFSDELIQKSIEYCTSTELLNSEGQYLGNIQMVGSNAFPEYVIGVMQSDSSTSQLDDIKIIVNSMIESVICDCWDEKKPGNFESVSSWIDAANLHHLENTSVTSKSTINGLNEKPILLEITTNENGYLWKFLITN